MSDFGTAPGDGEYGTTPASAPLGTSATGEVPANQSIRYDSTAEDETYGNERHSIQTYVSDMLALERHIAQPLHRQLSMTDTARYPDAHTAIARMANLADAHVTALEHALSLLGGHEADPLKSAWSELLGWGAAAIDSVRKTKVSKSLRDDYTALNLAAVSYTMLHATAVGLGDAAIAELARTHLTDYARMVMAVNQVIPAVVLAECVTTASKSPSARPSAFARTPTRSGAARATSRAERVAALYASSSPDDREPSVTISRIRGWSRSWPFIHSSRSGTGTAVRKSQ